MSYSVQQCPRLIQESQKRADGNEGEINRLYIFMQRLHRMLAKSRYSLSCWRQYNFYGAAIVILIFVVGWILNQIYLLSVVDLYIVPERAFLRDETNKWLSQTNNHQNLTCVQSPYIVDSRQFEILCTFELPGIYTSSKILYSPTSACNSLSVKALNGLLSFGGSLKVECAAKGTESNWLWHLHVTGTCPVIPIPSHNRSVKDTHLTAPAVEIQDYSRKSEILNVCPQNKRSPGRFLFFRLPQDFANQLISLAAAIMISRRHGFILILPSHFLTLSYPIEVTAEKGKRVPISVLYDLTRLEQILLDAGYTVELDLPISNNGHLSWLKQPLGHLSCIREVDFSLLKYLRLEDIVVDIGEPFLDIFSLDAELHIELFHIIQFLVSSFNPLIHSSADYLRQTLVTINPKGYNALHVEKEDDMMQNGFVAKKSQARWEEALLSHEAFDSQLPLYIANGNTGPHCQQFLCFDKSLLGAMTFIPEIFRESSDIMAAVDMLLLVEAKSFGGLACSTFSHLVASQRDASFTFDIDESLMPYPFYELVKFGSLSPLPPHLCTKKKIQTLKTLGAESKSKRQLAEFRTQIKKLGSSSIPSVFEMSYILDLFETPGKRDLAIQMLLEFTACRHSDNLGEHLRPFLEQDVLHKSLFGRALCHHFPSIGDATCKTIKSTKLLIVSHSLVSDGAPVVLIDYVLYLSRVLKLDMKLVTRAGMPTHTSLQVDLEKADIPISYQSTFDATDFDIILINTLDMWWYKGLSSKAKREMFATNGWASKTIWWVHESARDHFTEAHPYLPKVMKSVNHAIFTTSQSQDVYKDLIAHVPSTVIANPLDIHLSQDAQLQRLHLSHRSKEVQNNNLITFILIGTVHPGRHQLDFVRAALQLLQSCPKSLTLSFVVVGFDGVAKEYEAEVKAAVNEAGKDAVKHFRLVPRLNHFDCLQILSAADVLVSMSDFEAFGMTLLEAMSMGKPVITSKVDGVPSVIYHDAVDVPLGDASRLKEAMESMLDEKNRSLHAMQAIRHYDNFQTRDIRLKHIQVLAEAVKGRQTVSSSPSYARASESKKGRQDNKKRSRGIRRGRQR